MENNTINYTFETGVEISERLGSGSSYTYVLETNNEEEARLALSKAGRNYLHRYSMQTRDGKRKYIREYYTRERWYEF